MNILDWVLIGSLVIGFFLGFKVGLVYRLGNLVGLVAAAYVAAMYYQDLAVLLGDTAWSAAIAFIALLSIGMVGAGFLAVLLNKMFNLVKFIPFSGLVNRILGGVLSVIVQFLFLGLILFVLFNLDISTVVTQTINESLIGGWFVLLGSYIAILLPSDISDLADVF